jgi:beta-fructofuranosidase
VIGSGLVDRGGTALLYRGTALDDWTFVGQLLTGEPPAEGAVWECPELLDLGDKQLLHVSVGDRVVYFLGEANLSSPAFEVLDRGLLDHGDFYAPQSMRTSDDRILTWGWLPAARDVEAQWRAGWSGTLSLPRELGLVDGTLHQRPARELTALREDRLVDATHPLPAGGDVSVTPSSAAVELRLQAVRDPGAELDVVAMETPARTERTVLRWSDDRLVLDRSRSSRGAGTETPTLHAPLSTPTDDLSLRLFIDGSTIEVFAGQGDCLTGRIYPTRADATGLRLRARGGGVDVDVDAWTLGHAFPDAVAR